MAMVQADKSMDRTDGIRILMRPQTYVLDLDSNREPGMLTYRVLLFSKSDLLQDFQIQLLHLKNSLIHSPHLLLRSAEKDLFPV